MGKKNLMMVEKRWNNDANKDQLYYYDIHEDKDKDQWDTLRTMKLEEVIIAEHN